jgi:CRP/FNR family cyclic AMP-dependent transcriptional regulator
MYLDRVSLFAGLEQVQLDPLRLSGRVRSFPAGAVVVNEGDEGHSLFIVQQGSLKAYSMDENGREITLSLLDPGDYFGELALIDDAPRSTSVMALERSELFQIPGAAFLELIDLHPTCRRAIMRNLVGRIRELTDNVRALALVDVFGRISRLFETLAVEKEGSLCIERRLTQQDVANMVGASREMVNRILRDLVTGGYISVEQNRIQLRKKLPQHW